jgi:HTH-type transcriptional regulator/antitoxin HigA
MIEPVVDPASYQKAVHQIEALLGAKPGSREARTLDSLTTLVEAYERLAYPLDALDPIDAIELRREQLNWTRRDLEPLIGSRARVSEVLSRRRALTLPMIRRLHLAMSIPAEVLILESRRHQITSNGYPPSK